MANLIPPDAKNAIVHEYWFRVAIVWAYIIAAALIVVAILRLPALVFIDMQLDAYSGAYSSAQEKVDTVEESRVVIQDANQLAALLANNATSTSPITIFSELESIAGNGVTITGFQLTKDAEHVTEISVSGIASTRSTLANFSSGIEEHSYFKEAVLPISNLAKEKDITFNIEVVPDDI